MAAVTMAVAAAAVATMSAAALTSGGNCRSPGVGEAESSKGGMVLHLQALGSGVGCGTANKPTKEGAGGGGLTSLSRILLQRSRTPVPLVNIVKTNVNHNNDDNDAKDNNKGMVSRGGKRRRMNGISRRLQGGDG
jgi:hypothetical protein